MLVAGAVWASPGLRAADVGMIDFNGAIGPAAAVTFRAPSTSRRRDNDACLIIQLDTPGGLLDSTKAIVEKFYASKVPTVVYVAPSGAARGQRRDCSSPWRPTSRPWRPTPASARPIR